MKKKEEWLKLWDNAPIRQFINFSALAANELKEDGCVVTDDWARAMYLFQVYSGGGYASAYLGITAFWRALRCRYNVPYGEEIGNMFYREQLYTFVHNRDIPTLLSKISRIVSDDILDKNGELYSILNVIKEKTQFELKEYNRNSYFPIQKYQKSLKSHLYDKRSYFKSHDTQDQCCAGYTNSKSCL